MANVDSAFGLAPVGHLMGLNWSSSVERCYIHASYAVALYIGQPVDLQTETDYQDTTGRCPSIMAATAGDGNFIYGVIVGFEPLRTDLTKQYHPASTEQYAYVVTDPYVLFHIQDDGSATPTKLLVGQNANFAGTSGSTVTGLSTAELDLTTPAANASFQLYIRRFADLEDNEFGSVNGIWEVLINLHRLKPTGAGEAATGGILGVTAS